MGVPTADANPWERADAMPVGICWPTPDARPWLHPFPVPVTVTDGTNDVGCGEEPRPRDHP
jgi:hypothetical protein